MLLILVYAQFNTPQSVLCTVWNIGGFYDPYPKPCKWCPLKKWTFSTIKDLSKKGGENSLNLPGI